MIRKISDLILIADEKETGTILYRVFSKSGVVDIPEGITDIAPYCFSETMHLPKELQKEYDERDTDILYHEFSHPCDFVSHNLHFQTC